MTIKKGIYAASMSIFNQDLSLDIDSTIKHSEKLIKEGLHGTVLFGSTGCAQLISSKEKKKLIDKLKENKLKDHFIIGTGDNAEISYIEEIHSFIKDELTINKQFKDNISVVYGGSVNLTNYKEIYSSDKVDGLLIGGASLDPNIFTQIYNTS